MKYESIKLSNGLTLIETNIVMAMIIIVLTVALPIYSNFIVRTRVNEVLSIADSAKTVVSEICRFESDGVILAKVSAGYSFNKSKYLDSMVISGMCTSPVITLTTYNTGASIDPVLQLTGEKIHNSHAFSWTCTVINGQGNWLLDFCSG
mgnify:CR=1 FL=1